MKLIRNHSNKPSRTKAIRTVKTKPKHNMTNTEQGGAEAEPTGRWAELEHTGSDSGLRQSWRPETPRRSWRPESPRQIREAGWSHQKRSQRKKGASGGRAEELDGGMLDKTISNEGDLELGRTNDDERDCRLDRTSGSSDDYIAWTAFLWNLIL